MIDYIATYDIDWIDPSPYGPFKLQAAFLGWCDTILMADGSRCPLPNTTLVGTFENENQALATIEVARQAAGNEIGKTIKMSRLCILPFGKGLAFGREPTGLRHIYGGGFAGYLPR